MRVQQLTEQIHQIRLGRINCYLVEDHRRAVLIDTGLPAHAPHLLRLLGERDIALAAILLTHRHLDHTGSAAALAAATGATVVIHEADAAAVQGHERLSPLRGVLNLALGPLVALLDRRVFRFQPCPVTSVKEGWQGHGLRLVHLPGHTPGHSGYVHEASGVILAGDAAIGAASDRVRPPSRLFTLDRAAACRSQLRLAMLRAPIYGFGHGPALLDCAALERLDRTACA